MVRREPIPVLLVTFVNQDNLQVLFVEEQMARPTLLVITVKLFRIVTDPLAVLLPVLLSAQIVMMATIALLAISLLWLARNVSLVLLQLTALRAGTLVQAALLVFVSPILLMKRVIKDFYLKPLLLAQSLLF